MPRVLAMVFVVALGASCATGGSRSERDGSSAGRDGGVGGSDGAVRDAASTLRDGGTVVRDSGSGAVDAGAGVRDAGTGALDAGRGSTLDPDLDPADPNGAACDFPGQDCPGVELCRFYSSTENRCESCTECGRLNARCVDGTDCDILFACYLGRCVNICPLGTEYCGERCIDVGHPTHGVCPPY